MEQQLCLAHTKPSPKRMKPVTNNDRFIPKPSGGLWTSTWDAARRMSEWLEWCYVEEPDWVKPTWLLTIAEDARIYEINGASDLRQLCTRYVSEKQRAALAQFPALAELYPSLDFEAIAQDYDAIHLTAHGEGATRFSHPSLYGWDCESTLWLHWAFTHIEAVTVATRAEYEAEQSAEEA